MKPINMNYSVGVVILNYNSYRDTIDYISNDLLNQQGVNMKIVIVDNASTNNSVDILKNKFQNIQNLHVIQSDKNVGYASGNNLGIFHLIKHGNCKYIAISNNDIKLNDPWFINKLISRYISLDQAAFIAPVMFESNIPQGASAWKLPTKTSEVVSSTFCLSYLFRKYLQKFSYKLDGDGKAEVPVECLAGSFFIGDKDVFERLGGFDGGTFLYYEETILGHKVKEAGLINYLIKDIGYHHTAARCINRHYNVFRRHNFLMRSKIYYWKQHKGQGELFLSLLRFMHHINIIEWKALEFCRQVK
jgi:hypothetical protein